MLTTRWEAADSLGVAGGVEAWVKYKLGKEKGQGKGSKGHKGDGEEEGEGGGGGGGCIGVRTRLYIGRGRGIGFDFPFYSNSRHLKTNSRRSTRSWSGSWRITGCWTPGCSAVSKQCHTLSGISIPPSTNTASCPLHEMRPALQQGSGGTTRGGGGRLEEVAVTKSRLVGRLRLGDALADVEGEHGGGGGSSIGELRMTGCGGWIGWWIVDHPTPPTLLTTTAQRLLQRVTGSSPHPPTPPAGLDLDAELLVEDCVLEVEVEADGGGASAEASEASGAPRRWRSYQVEGSRAEVRRRCSCK